MRSARKAGITLLEVIVIVVLIGILVVVISALMAKSKEAARRMACASNLRQIAKACSMYADVPSNGGFFPTTGSKDDPFDVKYSMQSLGLLYRGYITDPKVFICLSTDDAPYLNPYYTGSRPTLPPEKYPMGFPPSYGYDPGRGPTSPPVAIAADKQGAGPGSDNHGANAGQNVLLVAGTVEFRTTVEHIVGADAAGKPIKDDSIYSRNPKLDRAEDSYIRQ